ncbi:MAG: asparagine synthase C-terminal domain-containing protein, partial [Verrucomicrobiaceae bacterium]
VFQEPFADPSQIPTLLVSKLAQRHVKVSLSGDGGDELFGGYDRYIRMSGLWKKISRLPFPARRALGAALSLTPGRLIEFANNALPQSKQLRDAGAKVQKLSAALGSRTRQDFYTAMRSFWPQSGSIVAGMETSDGRDLHHPSPSGFSFEESMMLQEQGGHLPDDLLVKLDRASMAVGLEAREPMLDHELVEFSWQLPLEWKIRNGQGKQILRRVLDRHIPREWFDRPKQGFLLPLDTWMRGPLRDWAEDLLSESRIKRDGYLISAPIRSVWQRFLAGAALQYPIWNILMFQVWLDRFKSNRDAA